MSDQQNIQHYNDFLAVQDLLFEEAAVIDSWDLDKWLDLYTEDAGYYVPSTDIDDNASPETSLFYIADDRRRMEERVIRIQKKTAHSEYPRSRVRHLVSNVRILGEEDGVLSVEAAFVVYRSKDGVTDVFMGRYDYNLVRSGNSFKIASKRCHMDLDGLRPQGRISIIL
jgi:p-cumate 2,3-dioxygenase beta subunit